MLLDWPSYRLESDRMNVNEPGEDQDVAGGPTHQPSVQPGAAHLPVRGQPTAFSGEAVQVLRARSVSPSGSAARDQGNPSVALPVAAAVELRQAPHAAGHRGGSMTSADFDRLWPRFSGRLAAALQHDGRALRREGVRLQVEMSVCAHEPGGVVLNAAVTLVRNGLRETSVAGLHVTDLPERGDEHSLAGLSHELTAVAAAWQRSDEPPAVLSVFAYPDE